MDFSLPTVAVDMDGARVVINESDFNADLHKLWVDEKTEDEIEDEAGPDEVEAVRRKPGPKPKK